MIKDIVKILYLDIRTITTDLFEQWLGDLSEEDVQAILRYRRKEDQYLRAGGRILLMEMLEVFGFDKKCLRQMKKTAHDKPFIPNTFHFNISHAGNIVLLAAAKHQPIGIDIEPIREMAFDDFQSYFNEEEWSSIYNNPNPYRMFFEFWTCKESLLKFFGCGIGELKNVVLKGLESGRVINRVGEGWIFPVEILEGYVCHLCVSNKKITFDVKPFHRR